MQKLINQLERKVKARQNKVSKLYAHLRNPNRFYKSPPKDI